MITLDKIKIVTETEHMTILDMSRFKKIEKQGKICSFKFSQRKPFLLTIEKDYVSGKVSIEFTGKILGSDYPKLISKYTIRQCFENINAMGFCSLNIDEIMSSAEVVKADVTKDVRGINTEQLTSYIQSHIVNYNMYVCRVLHNRNLIVEKNVVSNRCKKRITIYNKEKEMQKSDNVKFANSNGITNQFDGVCRFELNLNTKEQVRQALCIPDNKLSSVLESQANPIYDFLCDVVAPPQPISTTKWKSYTTLLVLKDCDYNLQQVEARIRGAYPRGTSIKNVMKPYRAMMEEISKGECSDYWNDLLKKLE